MIYIKNEPNLWQTITLTNHSEVLPIKMRLRLTNKLDGVVKEFEIYNFRTSKPYISIDFKLSETLTDGEYNYNLIDTSRGVISFGMAVVGEYTNNTQSYIKENKKIQYKG